MISIPSPNHPESCTATAVAPPRKSDRVQAQAAAARSSAIADEPRERRGSRPRASVLRYPARHERQSKAPASCEGPRGRFTEMTASSQRELLLKALESRLLWGVPPHRKFIKPKGQLGNPIDASS